MTEENHDQKEQIKCPHCKKDFGIGLDFEFDFEEDGASANARVTVEGEENG